VAFYDDRIEDIDYDERTDIAAITVETFTAKRSYQIAGEFKKRGVPVVMGGFHPTLLPGEAIQHADSVVIGEAEELWGKVLEDASSGKLEKFYQSQQRPSLKGLKPDRSIFKGKKYLPLNLVEFGRGCNYRCEFCSISEFFKHTYNHRPVADVIEEIEGLETKNVFFVDDNIIAEPATSRELFKELRPLKIRWCSQASLRYLLDEDLLRLMQRSGCIGVLVGLESLERKNLEQMHKGLNQNMDCYRQALKKLRKYGLAVYATFVFGYGQDDVSSFRETLAFSKEQKFFFCAFNHLVPFPGTPLYERLRKAGRLLYDTWWLDPDYSFGKLAFCPERLSPQELSGLCFEYRKKFYRFSSIIRRGCDLRANCRNFSMLGLFTSLNLLAQREVVTRQGWPLGVEDE
jgi:radical SAM superfamily enzyme YgiQ (UPF0313 family)